MRAKPQFRQHFSLIFLKIAQTVLRAVPGLNIFLPCVFGGFDIFARACARNPSFGNILSQRFLTFVPTFLREASRTVFSVLLSCHVSQPGLVGFGFLSRACARNPSFGNILSSRFFTFVPTFLREASRTFFLVFYSFFSGFVCLVILSQPRLVGFGFLSRACA